MQTTSPTRTVFRLWLVVALAALAWRRRFGWGIAALRRSYALVPGVWPDLWARPGLQDVGIADGPRILFNGNF